MATPTFPSLPAALAAFYEFLAQKDKEKEKPAENIPPLPPTLPASNPVADLKNRTALSNQYTPEAQRQLNQTPTTLDTRINAHDDGTLGYYHLSPPWPYYVAYPEALLKPDPSIGTITVNNVDPQQNVETLAHEFAHAYEDKYMSPQTRYAWQLQAPYVASDYAKERVSTSYENPNDEVELYATATEKGPASIPPDLRNWYYGMYRKDIDQPPAPSVGPQMAPPQVPAVPDFEALRRDYFDTSSWVPEDTAPLGYYANGLPIRSIPLPAQWEQPRFPSLGMYDQWNQMWGGYAPGEVRGG